MNDRTHKNGKISARKIEFERYKNDSNYVNVKFNEQNGALYAEHVEHNFDPTVGIFGIPRGDYERIASEVLFDYGMSVVLESEKSSIGKKTPEGRLDGKLFDIKGIEGTGKRNLIDKISNASKQNAEVIVLYYYNPNMFDEQNLIKAYHGYLKLSKNRRIQIVYYIVNHILHKIMA